MEKGQEFNDLGEKKRKKVGALSTTKQD